ncbi:hypothetical protein TNCV_3418171 [Trichonephila clavipes]|nr:hypothetical protein TNCV_3418171 [Trichonephila clavipes]
MGSMISISAEKANDFIAEIAFYANGVFSELRRLSFLFRKRKGLEESIDGEARGYADSKNTRLGATSTVNRITQRRIDGYSSRKRKGRPASFQAKCVVPVDVSLSSVGNHMSKKISNCIRNAAERDKKEDPSYMCTEWDVTLCIATCFSSFHGK